MNEFAWRSQLRDLRQPLEPRHDLWAGIEAQLDQPLNNSHETPPIRAWHRQRNRAWLIAASLTASLLVAGFIARLASHAPITNDIVSSADNPWKPSDPRLSGAAIELTAARMELEQAIRQSPNSDSLARLLERTERQQNQLRQLTRDAG